MSDGMVHPRPKDLSLGVEYAGATAEPAVRTGQPRVFSPIMVVEPPRGKHRVRLLKDAWNQFTGEFAGVRFKDGVSLDLVTEVTADRIAALMICEDENGVLLGKAYREQRHRVAEVQQNAVRRTLADVMAEQPELDPAAQDVAAVVDANAQAALQAMPMRSYDELMNVADTKGIAGLREIGDALGVKGRAIPDLIASIMRAQAIVAGLDPSTAFAG